MDARKDEIETSRIYGPRGKMKTRCKAILNPR